MAIENSTSSYWLPKDDSSVSKLEKYISYRKAISNFVRILTGRDDIVVKYSSGKSSYTDGNIVVISSSIKDTDFDPVVGLALHEASHCAITDFEVWNDFLMCTGVTGELTNKLYSDILSMYNKKRIQQKFPGKERLIGYFKTIINVIEDRRIDRYVCDTAPGYQGYYISLYNKYFNSPIIDKAILNNVWNDPTNIEHYLKHIINFTNPNRNLRALPALQSIWNRIDIPNIDRLKNTAAAASVTISVAQILFEAITDAIVDAEKNKKEEADKNCDSKSENNPLGTQKPEDDNLDTPESDSDNDSDEIDNNLDESEAIPLTDKELQKLEKALNAQEDFLNGETKKTALPADISRQIDAATKADVEFIPVGADSGKNYNCLVFKGITEDMWTSNLLGQSCIDPDRVTSQIRKGYITDYISEGIQLGKLLGKSLKTRDEIRETKTTRLDTGKLDGRLISELGYNSSASVFYKNAISTVTPVYVHITLDASGSMKGAAWYNAMKTAVAIAQAASMTASIECSISVRSTSIRIGSMDPIMWIIYDSKKDKLAAIRNKLYAVQAAGGTPEGLCFEAIQSYLTKQSKNKESYFINMSDGEPAFNGYEGANAIEHTRKQCERIRTNRIRIISYFISNSSNTTGRVYFKQMYGANAEVIDTTQLGQLSKSLNTNFQRK